MHTVDRGREPAGLAAVRKKLTPKWVSYYRNNKGNKPSDAKWRDFRDDLAKVFFSLCGYCEEVECKGEVDHFRPKSKYPERVYVWGNWVLACHTCNNMKGEGWPRGGYVNPCARSRAAQPESYFDFDTKTAEIVPRDGITVARRRRASNMIKHLALNRFHRCKIRVRHLLGVAVALEGRGHNDPSTERYVRFATSGEARLSSITRVWLKEQGHLR
ncbi:MAG: HNH endonuclease [Planctomycetota bacterium]|jgi:uncharacterized protein (TIGR02646 family)